MRRNFLFSILFLLFAFSLIQAQTTAYDYLIRGREQYKNKNYREAINDFTNAIELDPKYRYRAYLWRATAKYVLKDFDGAIDDYTNAHEIKNDERSLLYRAEVKLAKKDFDGSIADSTEIIKRDKTYVGDAYAIRGETYLAMYKLKEAIADLTKTMETGVSSYIYKLRAEAYEKIGEKKKAAVDRAKAAESKKLGL
jgi:tetratricopeptide (TPR) repeat protein